MERIRLKVESREVGRKGVLNRLRKSGGIPAILYGRGSNPQQLALNKKELLHAMKQAGVNAILELEGEGEKKSALLAMLKEFQTDPVTHQILHVDLLRIDLKEKVGVRIPVQVVGKSVGVEKGGIVDLARRELEGRCLPGNIPDKIEVDISALDIGDNIHVDDLKLPEGVEIPHDVNFNIVSIAAPRKEEELAAVAPAVEAGAVPATEMAEKPVEGAAGEGAEKGKAEKAEKTEKTEKGKG